MGLANINRNDYNNNNNNNNSDQQWTGQEQSSVSSNLSLPSSLQHLMQAQEHHDVFRFWQSPSLSSSVCAQGTTTVLKTQLHGEQELPLPVPFAADIDVVDAHGRNVLHHAIQSYSELSSLSLDSSLPNNSNHNHDDDDERQGRVQRGMAQKILQAILASPSSKSACLQTTHDGGFTPLHLCLCLQYLSSSVNMVPIPESITCAVASRNPRALFIQDEEGDTPLHTAFRYGASEDVIRVLIELAYSAECESECEYPMTVSLDINEELGCGADSNNVTDTDEVEEDEDCTPFSKLNNDGDTPLHTAITHEGTCDSIRLLLDAHPQGMFLSKNMDMFLQQEQDEETQFHCHCQNQCSPLHLAAEHGRYDVLEVIVQSHAATGAIEELLAMKDGDGVNGISVIYMLWDRICRLCGTTGSNSSNHSEVDNSDSRVRAQPDLSLEIMEAIATLLNSTNRKDIAHNEENYQDLAIYKLLETSIRLGNDVVPPGYVSFLIRNHRDILRRADKHGRLPLHLAAMNYPCKSTSMPTSGNGSRVINEENNSSLDQDEEPSLDHHMNLNDSYRLNERGYNYEGWDHRSYMTPKEIDRFSASATGTGNQRHDQHILSHSNVQMIKIILDEYPAAASIEDVEGRLPFHLAIEAGVPWDEMKNLFAVNPHIIQRKDPKTGLLPFMLAAADPYSAVVTENIIPTTNTTATKLVCKESMGSGKLDTVYRLLQSSPDLIPSSKAWCNFNAVEGKGGMDDTDFNSCAPSPSKRRRTMK